MADKTRRKEEAGKAKSNLNKSDRKETDKKIIDEEEPNIEELDKEVAAILNTINGLLTIQNKETISLDIGKGTMRSPELEGLKTKGFREAQLYEISRGQEQYIDVEVYAKECYNWKQMHELRMGLLDEVDTELFSNPYYTAEQMREIRLGLRNGIDVTEYAKLILSASDMKKIRRKLTVESYKTRPYGFALDIHDDDTMLNIRITDDCMEAYIVMPQETKRKFSTLELKKVLERYEVTDGLIEENLQKLADGEMLGEEVKAAQGRAPETGKSGRYELFFESNLPKSPRVLSDGRVDYSNVIVADSVRTGQILAQYHMSQPGRNGNTVSGIPIESRSGKELRPLTGSGIRWDKKRDIYIATMNGFAAYNEASGTLNVWKAYIVEGDVNRYNGNITFDGSIYIRGSVNSNAEIKATGDIVIDGYMEDAMVQAGQNVIIKGGVNAAGRGYIDAGGKVMASFFESATVRANGSVEGNYFLNCDVRTDDKLIARGSKARIMGGKIVAATGVESAIIGNYGSNRAMLEVGDLNQLDRRYEKALQAAEKAEREIQQLEEGKCKLRMLLGEDGIEENAVFKRTCEAISVKQSEIIEFNKEAERLEQVKSRALRAYVRVPRELQQGVFITINDSKKDIAGTVYDILLTRERTK